ncbi:MAG: hypothetical protein ACREMX_13945, partial [Gemmatimonadales bacterium]
MTAVAWPDQLPLAKDLAELAGRSTEWPGLGRRLPAPLRLIVVPDARRLDSLTRGRAPEWGAAVALPTDRTIVLRADAGDLYHTRRQQQAHHALQQEIPVRVPLWFDEGYAACA